MKKLVLAGCATLFLTTGSSEYNNLTDDQLSDIVYKKIVKFQRQTARVSGGRSHVLKSTITIPWATLLK